LSLPRPRLPTIISVGSRKSIRSISMWREFFEWTAWQMMVRLRCVLCGIETKGKGR